MGMMGKKKKKSRASTVEHRAPHGMPEEVFIGQEVEEPLMSVPPLMTPVEMVQQPSMVETIQMVPPLMTTQVPVGPASVSYGGVMPTMTSYGGFMPSNTPYSMGSTLPGGVL